MYPAPPTTSTFAIRTLARFNPTAARICAVTDPNWRDIRHPYIASPKRRKAIPEGTGRSPRAPRSEANSRPCRASMPPELSSAPGTSLAIVIPMYNEILGGERCVRELLAAVSRLPMPGALVVVDDGSTDGTGE